MRPSDWSTTYNSQYQDRRKYISPNAGTSDDSYRVRTQSYYGTRASLAEHGARTSEVMARTNGGCDVKSFGSTTPIATTGRFTSSASGNRIVALGATYPPSSNRFTSVGYQTSRMNQFPSLNVAPGTTQNYVYKSKDLWNTPVERHTGLYSNYSTIVGGVNPKHVTSRGDGMSIHEGYYINQHDQTPAWDMTYSTPSPQPHKEIASPKEWDQYHIPGYQGFVRGIQFTHSNTFGKTTRNCLNVPTDIPLEP